MNKILCPICKSSLQKEDRQFVCKNKHHFDQAKSGYVNLLLNRLPSGDNLEMIRARRTILEKGYFLPILEGCQELFIKLGIKSFLDVGCGEGYYTRGLANLVQESYGVDISKYACDQAAKKDKKTQYIVASGFDLPFADLSLDALIHLFAIHDDEFSRIAAKYIISVVPNPNHLIELKEVLYDDVFIHHKEEPHFSCFQIQEVKQVTFSVFVDEIIALIKMTPYFYTSNWEKWQAIKPMNVTIDVSIYLFIRMDKGAL